MNIEHIQYTYSISVVLCLETKENQKLRKPGLKIVKILIKSEALHFIETTYFIFLFFSLSPAKTFTKSPCILSCIYH